MSDKKKNTKCSAKRGFCWALGERMGSGHEKGFNAVHVMNMTKGKMRCIGVRYRLKPSDRGLMLNVCPFCEQSLRWWADATKKAESIHAR